MKLTEFFKRHDTTEDALRNLESSLTDMLLVEEAPTMSPDWEETIPVIHEDGTVDGQDQDAMDVAFSGEHVITSYSSTRLAEHNAVTKLMYGTQEDIEAIGTALSRLKVAHNQTREFLGNVYSAIYRANDLENSCNKLSEENRILRRQSEEIRRIRSQYEGLVDAFRRRETKLTETAEALRGELSTAKLELVELHGKVSTLTAERQETLNTLAATTIQLERMSRENEMLRDKQISLSADFDLASRKRSEAERKADELAAMHARESAEVAELRSHMAVLEVERNRLQKQFDSSQSKLVETTEALAVIETEMAEQAKRHDTGLQSLLGERDTLLARLDVLSKAELDLIDRNNALTDECNRLRAEDAGAGVGVH